MYFIQYRIMGVDATWGRICLHFRADAITDVLANGLRSNRGLVIYPGF